MQRVYEKYQSKGFVLLTVNTSPGEDSVVPALLKNGGYTFTALKVPDAMWSDTYYNVHAVPLNVLIDSRGRAVFQPAAESEFEQQAFEEELQGLLERTRP